MKKNKDKFEGKKAPLFTLVDQQGNKHSLKEYRGQKVLLYFYPKDMTSGCTLEAQTFQSLLTKFKQAKVAVLGISKDDEKRHSKFVEKEKLSFTLLADIDTKVSDKYGVWVEKSMYGKKYMGIQRDSFLIDEEGKVLKHFVKVKPALHPQEVLDYLKEIKCK